MEIKSQNDIQIAKLEGKKMFQMKFGQHTRKVHTGEMFFFHTVPCYYHSEQGALAKLD